MDKRLQGCADIINECIQCGECKHLAYVEDVDYMECSLGIEGNTKGKCEKFEKIELLANATYSDEWRGGKNGKDDRPNRKKIW